MFAWFSPFRWLAGVTLILILALSADPGRADAILPARVNEESTCLGCHENLYYLYDTGKWFCVAKAPMACVSCHGGDPTAIDQAAAHQHRLAHPIINGDTAACQQCHSEDCAERVQQFDRMAGISQNIRLGVSTQPRVAAAPQPIVQAPTPEIDPLNVLWSLGGVVVLVAALGALWRLRHHRAAHRGK